MHWLLGRISTLSIDTKLLLYKAVLKTYRPMEFNHGGQPPISKSKNSSALNPRLSAPF
jgi:hypothetical protein